MKRLLLFLLILCPVVAARAQSCPGTPGTYFVQCKTAQVGAAKTLSATFNNPSTSGDTILAVFQVIQSNGNNGDQEMVVDNHAGTYTSRLCQSGGAGNATNCIYESHAGVTAAFTVTVNVVMAANPPSNKNIHLAILEYKNLTPFLGLTSNTSAGGASISTPPTGFNVPANSFYIATTGWQGFPSTVTFTGPMGYTERALRNDNPGGIGTGAIDTFDDFISGAQTNYSISIGNSDSGSSTNLSIILLTYGVSAPSTRRRSQVY